MIHDLAAETQECMRLWAAVFGVTLPPEPPRFFTWERIAGRFGFLPLPCP